MATLTQTDSGLIKHESTWASCPAWLTEIQDTAGRITYSGGKAHLTTSSTAQFAYFRTTSALSKSGSYVCRIRCDVSAGYPYLTSLLDLASAPTGALTLAPGVLRLLFYSSGTPTIVAVQDPYSTMMFSVGESVTTEHIYEQELQSGQYTLRLLDTDMTEDGAATVFSNPYTNNPWWGIGDFFSAYHTGTYNIAYMQIIKGLTAAVTGLSAGNHVDVTDPADAVVAHATSTGTNVSVDISILQYPYNGKIKVYDTDGGTLQATYTGNIYGGWMGDYVGIINPTVISITPDSGADGTSVEVTDLAGTGFVTGAGVKLKKAGEDDITATSVSVDSDTKIECVFPITSAAIGLWDIEVTNTDTGTGTLSEGFDVFTTTTQTIETKICIWDFTITEEIISGESALAYVQYVGDETHTHTITSGASQDFRWRINEGKWVYYSDFVEAFGDPLTGAIPDFFTVYNMLYPDIPE